MRRPLRKRPKQNIRQPRRQARNHDRSKRTTWGGTGCSPTPGTCSRAKSPRRKKRRLAERKEKERRKKREKARAINIDVDSDDDSNVSILNDSADGGDAGGGSGNGEDDTAVSPKPNAAAVIINRLKAATHGTTPLLLPASDYRAARCHLSGVLLDAANEDEKACWGDKLLKDYPWCTDLEDKCGFYHVLGCTKTSSDQEIAAAFKEAKTVFFNLARTHHPDKTDEEENKEAYDEANELYVR